MRTRIATERDVESLLPLVEAFCREDLVPWNRQTYTRGLSVLTADGSLGFVLLAEEGEALCGYAILTYGFDLEFAGRDSYITEFYLAPSVRGRGLSKQLLDAVQQTARDNRVNAIHLCVRADNAVALQTYRRAGFAKAPRDLLTKTL